MISAPPSNGLSYRSYSQLHSDIKEWLQHLPEISAVAGIPRSGNLAALYISFLRHIPLVPIETLLGDSPAYRPNCSRPLREVTGPILVVDDTCCMGRTINLMRSKINRDDILWGAVYASDGTVQGKVVDVAGYRITTCDHTFQWNLLRDVVAKNLLIDFDGVLCPDWHRASDTGEYLSEYESWLNTVPLTQQVTQPLLGIVTARLEKYRPQTEAWLQRHGIQYKHLVMHKGESHQRNPVRHKSDAYHRFSGKAVGFVESCPKQASAIAKETGKPVLCYETGELHNPTVMPPLWK